MDLMIIRSRHRTQIRVFLDRDDGFLTHQDCIYWSGKICDLIDSKDLFPDDYRLEISSPGIGHPLKDLWEFTKNIEKRISVDCTQDDEGECKNFSGILTSVDETGINLKIQDRELKINWPQIKKAQIQTLW
jgi:ribosome maturation factor RimP